MSTELRFGPGTRHEAVVRGIAEARQAHRVERQAVMAEYNRTIFDPQIAHWQEECGRLGHVAGRVCNNGFGGSWEECGYCGARIPGSTQRD